MTSLFIVHLNHSGKEKQIVKKEEKIEDAIEFIKSCNRGSSYLKIETVVNFLVNESYDDGVYIIYEDDQVKVYRLERLTFDGYLYGSSTYLMRKLVNEYEIIKGNFNEL
jgi:hypothetical protein